MSYSFRDMSIRATRFVPPNSWASLVMLVVIPRSWTTLQIHLIFIVPSIVTGSIAQVSFVVMKDCFHVSETFSLTLSPPPSPNINDNQIEQQESMEQIERCMRDLILSVLSLEGLVRKRLTDDSSFKLTVKTAERIDKLSPEMTRAFDEGTWYRPSIIENGEGCEKTGKVQPLHHGSLPSGGTMQMNLVTDS